MMNARRLILKLLVAAAVCLAGYLVYRSLGRYSFEEIVGSVKAIPGSRLTSALGFVACSYLCLTGFDALAVRYAGARISYPRTALASFTALSIGHNVGLAALSSGAVRYRFYSRWGLSPEQVAKVIVFCGVTVGLGLVTLAGFALLLRPGSDRNLLGLDRTGAIMLGLACLILPLVYLLICCFVRRRMRLWNWSFEPPQPSLAVGQVVVGTLNFACVAACIHQLLSGFVPIGYLEVASAYVTANIAALISHVPGGLGVLEATMLGILSGAASIGALVAFRVIYFFVPLMFGLPLLIASEAYYRRRPHKLPEQVAG